MTTSVDLARRVRDRLLLLGISADAIDGWIQAPHHGTPRLLGVSDAPVYDGDAEPQLFTAVWLAPPAGLLGWPSAALATPDSRYWLVTTWADGPDIDQRLRVVHVATSLRALLDEFPEAASFLYWEHDALTDDDRTRILLTATRSDA